MRGTRSSRTATTGTTGLRGTPALAWQALRSWGPRQFLVAGAAALAVGLLIGLATVLIPNPVFARDIPPVWWNYPVWILTSALSGLLVATYVTPDSAGPGHVPEDAGNGAGTRQERRGGRWGTVGGVLAWFAVGCPVCNKLALLAFGYSGAITWFAPVQPVLALASGVLLVLALLWRLRGQVACPLPARRDRVVATTEG